MIKTNKVNLKMMTTGERVLSGQLRETQQIVNDFPSGHLIAPAFLQMSPTDILNTNQMKLEPERARHREGDIGVAARMRDGPVPEKVSRHSSWRIPPVVCSPQVHIRGQDSDIVARAIRSHLWESPSQPPSIVTPSILHLIRREGDMLETAVETLLDQRKIGLR